MKPLGEEKNRYNSCAAAKLHTLHSLCTKLAHAVPKRLLILAYEMTSYILLGAFCCFLQLSASYVKVESFFGLAE
jgi:hypothetical protein